MIAVWASDKQVSEGLSLASDRQERTAGCTHITLSFSKGKATAAGRFIFIIAFFHAWCVSFP